MRHTEWRTEFSPVSDTRIQSMNGYVPKPHRPRLPARQRRFGDYIRQCRQAKRLGLRDCAHAIGLAPGHLSNIENARVTPPSEPYLAKMAEVFKVPASHLLARAGRMTQPDLQRFWQSPMIPSLIMATTGWPEDDAKVFQESVLAVLTE
jgi:transcriptional regulator with XRE-family HTH domain